MLNLTAFREGYPEFREADSVLVQACLDRAAERIGPAWGELENQGHGLLTAHILSNSPNGLFARLEDDKNSTTYYVDYLRLRDVAGIGLSTF